LNVSDRNLPKEAVTDIDKMRETLETIVEQSKLIGKDAKQTSDATALLEEATATRGSLARDDFDANRWKTENADSREMMIASRSVVVNAVNEQPTETTTQNDSVASNPVQTNAALITSPQANTPKPNESVASLQPVPNNSNTQLTIAETPKPEVKKPEETNTTASENTQTPNLPVRNRRVEGETQNQIQPQQTNANNAASNNAEAANNAATNNASQIEIGSLIAYATERVNPVYPQMARNMRTTGVVKVELIIDENGQVVQVQNASGPAMLQNAAKDAVKKWRFKPFTRDGQPVRASGFVNFNFSL